jgi:hypothetical protein
LIENKIANPAERMKIMRMRRQRQGFANCAWSCRMRARGRTQPDCVAKLNPDSERDAVLWIEAISN